MAQRTPSHLLHYGRVLIVGLVAVIVVLGFVWIILTIAQSKIPPAPT
jgi:heme/copper-type cytochrome/quinol oxidase subunit 4